MARLMNFKKQKILFRFEYFSATHASHSPLKRLGLLPRLSARPPIARIIHELCYCNRRNAAATSLATSFASQRVGSPLATSTYCFKYASLSRGSTHPSRLASRQFRHEPS